MSPTDRLTDRKREAIVLAAIAEFKDGGFKVTSMDKIAAGAGVSKRTVYNHFASKEALFSAILDRLWETIQASPDVPYRSDVPMRAQLGALMQAKMALLNDPSFMDLSRVAMSEIIHSPALTGEMVAKFGQQEERVTTWVRAAQADGRLAQVDPAFAGQQLNALIKAFAFWPQLTVGQPRLSEGRQQEVVDSAVDMFLAAYTPR
jgi:TetR/AcrR family transcriptional regulator of autoinduction and epiphytic fitness